MEWLAKWTSNKQWKKISQEKVNAYSILEKENSKAKGMNGNEGKVCFTLSSNFQVWAVISQINIFC